MPTPSRAQSYRERSGRIVVRPGTLLLAFVAIISSACRDNRQPSLEQGTTLNDTAAAVDSNATALALDGEGLRVFVTATGSSRPLPFGIPSSELIATLTRVLGSPSLSTGENADCAAQFVEWPHGLTTWITRDQFAGWSVNRDSSLTTASGIGVGSTRTALLDVYAAEIQTTSLGEEFTAGHIAGLLESASDSATISHLWAGVTCIAR